MVKEAEECAEEDKRVKERTSLETYMKNQVSLDKLEERCDKDGVFDVENDRITPSLLGEAATNQAAVNPERTIKRLISQKFEDRKLEPGQIDGKPYIEVQIKDGETKKEMSATFDDNQEVLSTHLGGEDFDLRIMDYQGNRITPLGVGFTNCERLIGEAAKNQAAEITTFDVKRLNSQKLEDKQVQKDTKLVGESSGSKKSRFPWGAYRSSSVEQNMDFSEEQELASEESSSDEEVESEDEIDPKGISMICPRRSDVLDILTLDLRMRLMDNVSVSITTRCARKVLGRKRFRYVLETGLARGDLRLHDSGDRVYVYWPVPKLDESYYLSAEARKLLKSVAGEIRDQLGHDLCWIYALCDLISSTRMLHGLDKEFVPLCPRYLCQNVNQKAYQSAIRKSKDSKSHRCYGGDKEEGLIYAKRYGIPKENPKIKKFRCCIPRRVCKNTKKYKVKDVFHYKTLQDALIRLKTHPICASLVCFDGYDKRELYELKEGARYLGEHDVVMFDCIEIDGKSVAVCKSSNGKKRIGFDGYIFVSLEVMLLLAGVKRKVDEPRAGHIRPQYLLRDFYSVDVEMSPDALIGKNPSKEEQNRKFLVEDGEEFDYLLPPKNYWPLKRKRIIFGKLWKCGTLHAVEQSRIFKRGGRLSSGKSEKIRMTNEKGLLSQEETEWMVKEAEEISEEDKKVRERLEAYVYNMKSQAAVNPERTTFDVKRLIGRKLEDKQVQKDRKLVPYKTVNKDGKPYNEVKIKDGETTVFNPEEIADGLDKDCGEDVAVVHGGSLGREGDDETKDIFS